MPVYEYQCSACHHEFEREQRISDAPVKKCPECGAMKAKRLISRTSFVLKGSGWYNDLYSSAKPKSGADSPSEASADKSDSSKGESKDGGAGKGESKDGGSDKGASKKGSKKGATGSDKGGAKGSKAAA